MRRKELLFPALRTSGLDYLTGNSDGLTAPAENLWDHQGNIRLNNPTLTAGLPIQHCYRQLLSNCACLNCFSSDVEFSVTASAAGENLAYLNVTVLHVSAASAGDYFCNLGAADCETLSWGATLRVTGQSEYSMHYFICTQSVSVLVKEGRQYYWGWYFFSGAPHISLQNDSFIVNTLTPFLITGKVAGFPEPEITISREVNGVFTQEANSQFNYSFDGPTSTLSISIPSVVRADGGQYMIEASNIHGDDQAMFTIIPVGK